MFSVGSAEVAPLGFACALVFHVWHICHPIQHTILYISRLRLVIPSLLLPEAMQPLVPYTSLSAPLRYHSFFFLFSFPLIPLFFSLSPTEQQAFTFSHSIVSSPKTHHLFFFKHFYLGSRVSFKKLFILSRLHNDIHMFVTVVKVAFYIKPRSRHQDREKLSKDLFLKMEAVTGGRLLKLRLVNAVETMGDSQR